VTALSHKKFSAALQHAVGRRKIISKPFTMPLVSHSTKATTKPKAVKKITTAKYSDPSRYAGEKMSVGQKTLSRIAELRLLGISTPPRVQVAFFFGYADAKIPGFMKAL
jgi:hypothetical protein